jgi:molybdopterin converting factor small subunit
VTFPFESILREKTTSLHTELLLMIVLIKNLSQFSVTAPLEATFADIHAMLGVDGVFHTSLVNGRRTDPETKLKEGDTIVLMPLLSGG